VYLCDIKYWTSQTGKAYSLAPDYATIVWDAVDAMFRQVGPCVFDEHGMLIRGVVVRHLVLPGRSFAAKKIIGRLFERYGNQIVYSIMNQYTPLENNPGIQAFPELLSPLSPSEYEEVADFAINLDLEYAYLQEGEAISESFIPLW
jgi:putative pyruvate formate lyase activating enzyme